MLPALGHDIEEAMSGDIPGPVKKHLKGLEFFEQLRPKFESDYEKKLAKVCDKLELVLDLREQLEDTGRLPKKLMEIYEDEVDALIELSKEIGKTKEVKTLMKELSK